MSVESREDATRLAQQIVERGASIVTIIEELLAQDTHGLACNKTVQLKDLSAENTAAAQILACWLLNQPRPLPPPPPLIRPQISLLLVHPDNHPDSLPTLIKIVGNRVTPAMLEAAKDLLHTLTTGERTLPVLEAAHIKPYSEEGPHLVSNGLLLRSDLHILFDDGYLTVTEDLRVDVSKCIKEEFENGREYYQYRGKPLFKIPGATYEHPSPEFLRWHNVHKFLG